MSLTMETPVAVSIAGSDSSGGAGIQADLKTFTHFNVYAETVITCVVAEVPGKVLSIQPINPGIVRDQLNLSLSHFPVTAIKTGMLYSQEIVDLVCEVYEALPKDKRPFLVVDPVMIATSGDSLIQPGAFEQYKARLFPLADLVTPNLDEAGSNTRDEVRFTLRNAGCGYGTLPSISGPILVERGASPIGSSGGFVDRCRRSA